MQRTFSPEFREQAVKRVLAGHQAVVLARELDISESLLNNWLARYWLRTGAAALQTEQAEELTRLKRLLAQRHEAVATLNKAAYLAKESR